MAFAAQLEGFYSEHWICGISSSSLLKSLPPKYRSQAQKSNGVASFIEKKATHIQPFSSLVHVVSLFFCFTSCLSLNMTKKGTTLIKHLQCVMCMIVISYRCLYKSAKTGSLFLVFEDTGTYCCCCQSTWL